MARCATLRLTRGVVHVDDTRRGLAGRAWPDAGPGNRRCPYTPAIVLPACSFLTGRPPMVSYGATAVAPGRGAGVTVAAGIASAARAICFVAVKK